MDDGKKKIAIVTVCSLILVAMVVALVCVNHEEPEEPPADNDINASKKAITSICDATDYKKTCVDSLESSGTNATEPHELIKVIFQATTKYIEEAVNNSTTLEEVEKDPRGKDALETCKELASRAGDDLKRSFAKFNTFDITNVNDLLMDLKIWLSAAITHQQTCLDGFQDVPGEAGMKMKNALTAGMQMTSNSLAMVQELSTFLEGMGIQSFKSRRLLNTEHHPDEIPDWMDVNERKLLATPPHKVKANLVVAMDGSGKYKTINEALKAIPKNGNETFVLYIKEGVYRENVKINSSLTNLMIIGDGSTKTRITGSLNYKDGVGTYHTATVAVHGEDFIARDIGFENSAGAEKHQAVALRVSADKAVFFNCQMDGYQDTLYVHTYRQFYRDCVISGTIDFVFGDAAAVFQGCTFLVRKPLDNQQCIVTAQGRKEVREATGLVIQNCTFTADKGYYPVTGKAKTYLGRPWKEFSRTIIMESFLDSLIEPQGYLPWNETFALETLFYTEFNNRGPGAPKAQRIKWPGIKELPADRIQRFIAAEFLDGNRWISKTNVPYAPGFIFPVPKEDPNINYSPVSQEENKDLGAAGDKTAVAAAAAIFSFTNTNASATATPTPTVPAPHAIVVTPPPSMAPTGSRNSDTKAAILALWVRPHDILALTPAPSMSPATSPAPAPSMSPVTSPGPAPAPAPWGYGPVPAPAPAPWGYGPAPAPAPWSYAPSPVPSIMTPTNAPSLAPALALALAPAPSSIAPANAPSPLTSSIAAPPQNAAPPSV